MPRRRYGKGASASRSAVEHGKSAVDARHRAKAHIYPTLCDVEVTSLRTDMLRQWLAKLAKALPRTRPSPASRNSTAFDGSEEAIRRRKSSANRTWTILRAALNHAFHDDLVASDAAWRKVKAFRGVDAARIRYLTVAEARRLINACDPDFRPLVQAALQTGCRYSELCRLESRFQPGRRHVGDPQDQDRQSPPCRTHG